MVELKGRSKTKTVACEMGMTLLDLSLRNGIDWGFSCSRGTCARCRCLIMEGAEFLSEPTDAEIDRLDEEEIAQGYRLGCQTRIVSDGFVKAVHRPYF